MNTLDKTQEQPAGEDLPVDEARAEAVKSGTGVKTIRFQAGKDLQDIG